MTVQRRLADLMRDCWSHEAPRRPNFSAILDALDRIDAEAIPSPEKDAA
jgi:hypothetical protein